MKKNISVFCILFCLCTKIFAQAATQEDKPLVIGTTSGYAPYVSLNEKGEYEGFDIDLAKLLAEKLGRKLVLKDLGSMPSLMIALQQGRVDALIWAISITEKRMKTMEMVYYQGEKVTQMPLVFWNEIPSDVKVIEDFTKDAKKVICIEAGSYQEEVIKKFPKVSVKFIDKISDGIMEIKYKKSLATAIDPSLLPRFLQQYPEIKVLHLPLPPSEQSLGNGVCISKTNQQLANEVKIAIDELQKQGIITELEKKWNLCSEGSGP